MAGLYHTSVEPRSEREHLKMTFVFRHPKGDKQPKGVASSDIDTDELRARRARLNCPRGPKR